jgi:DNA-binding MarR family transcriptional regulator
MPAPLGFRIHQLCLALRAAYDQELRPLHLTVAQLGALAAIEREPGASVARLAQEKLVAPQSMAQHVAALERDGLVARTAAVGRGHVLELRLTPEGAAALRRGLGLLGAVEARLWSGLDPRERARFGELLERHLTASVGQPGEPARE